MKKVCLFVSFFVPLIVYLFTLAPGITLGDAGELISAAYGMGVPHPPGFPTWTFLTHWFTKIPISNIAWRANFSSAVYSAASCAMLFLIVKKILMSLSSPSYAKAPEGRARPDQNRDVVLANGSPLPTIVALTCSLTLAFTRNFWGNAVVAEVYNLMVLSSLSAFYLLLLWSESHHLKHFFLFALICGLGVGVHYEIVLIFPAFIVFGVLSFFGIKRGKRVKGDKGGIEDLIVSPARLLGLGLLGFGAGLLIFLYLPLAASSDPIINWGDPSNWHNFWEHITRKQYAVYDTTLGGFNLPAVPIFKGGSFLNRVFLSLASCVLVWWREFGVLSLLVVPGLGCLLTRVTFRAGRSLLGFFTALALCYFIFVYFSRPALPFKDDPLFDSLIHFAFTAVLIALGILQIYSAYYNWALSSRKGEALSAIQPLDSRFRGNDIVHLAFKYAFPPLLIAPLFLIARNYSFCDWSKNRVGDIFVDDVLNTTPQNAAIIGSNDLIFPIIYALKVEHRRGDIALFDRGGYLKPYAYDLPAKGNAFRFTNAYALLVAKGDKKVIDNALGGVYTINYSGCDNNNPKLGIISVIKKADNEMPVDFEKQYRTMLAVSPKQVANDYNGSILAGLYHTHFGLASGEFEKALQFNPRSFGVLQTVGSCYLAAGQKDKAVEILNQAAELYPSEPEVYYDLGRVHFALSDYEASAGDFEKSLSLSGAYLTRSGKGLGSAYLALGRLEEAAGILQKVYDSEPENPSFNLLYNLGLAYFKLGDCIKAKTLLEDAKKINNSSAVNWEDFDSCLNN